MMKKNPVVHFEMPAKDKQRVSTFYENAFGWEMQHMGEEYGGYIMAMTTESDKNGPKEPGAINGGFWETQEEAPPHLVLAVDDINEHMEIVKKEGGKIIGKVTDIPNVGKFVMFEDTEGNKVGMLQPAEM